jgi:hypothetical protein
VEQHGAATVSTVRKRAISASVASVTRVARSNQPSSARAPEEKREPRQLQ